MFYSRIEKMHQYEIFCEIISMKKAIQFSMDHFPSPSSNVIIIFHPHFTKVLSFNIIVRGKIFFSIEMKTILILKKNDYKDQTGFLNEHLMKGHQKYKNRGEESQDNRKCCRVLMYPHFASCPIVTACDFLYNTNWIKCF